MFARINSLGIFGLETYSVEVEADVSGGKDKFDIVGLPDAAVSESKERVRSALKNSGYSYPPAHITVNLAPGDVKKEGPVYDLPILLAILCATRQLEIQLDDSAFIGELSLHGETRRINGVLPMVIAARNAGLENVFVPAENAAEASVVRDINVFPVNSVAELTMCLKGKLELLPVLPYNGGEVYPGIFDPDFADVRGQLAAKRALEVAAAGGHNCLLIGSPGSGKSMLAKRIPSILPDMTFEEELETTKIYSVAGELMPGMPLIQRRPFRAPHHTISSAGLSGGGSVPRPGELSLAHNGVLFLDELPEFGRTTMECLRQPLEDGQISISRVAGTLSYPCSIMLVAAMNPCPCGYAGHPTKPCTCPKGSAERYLARVSGPLLDRIDIHVNVPPAEFTELSAAKTGESSKEIRARVNAARERQQRRLSHSGIACNAKMSPEQTKQLCVLSDEARKFLSAAFERLGLSGRAYDKILRLARTVADLDGADIIQQNHVAEAISYRSLDRKAFGG